MNKILNSKKLLSAGIFFRKTPWFLGRHAFLIILFFVFLSVVFGEFLFYNFVILAKNQAPIENLDNMQFDQSAYEKIIDRWQKDTQTLQQNSALQNYSNPFINNDKKNK